MAEPRIARLPDGTQLQFPAETADDVMDAAVARHVAEAGGLARGREANAAAPVGDNLQRSVVQGLTFGFGDEFNAGVRATVQGLPGMRGAANWSDRYNEALGAERGRNQAYQQDSPVAATVGNVVGGVMGPGLALAPAARGAGWIQSLARSAPVRGAVAGGVGGGVTGFGEGRGGFADRAENAVEQGLFGAGAGGALGAGVNIAGRVGGRIADVSGFRNPELAADRQVLRALSRDNVTTADLVARQAGQPQHGILADVGGRNTVNLAAVAANTPGRAMEAADSVTQMRRAGAPDRIAEAVDANLGGGGGTRVADEVEALRTQRTAQAGPLYDQAFAQAAPDTPALREILQLPVIQDSIASSVRNQRIGAAGSGQPVQLNAMQMLDAAKRGLDERIGATLDPVTNRIIPGRGEENIALTQLRSRLLQELDAVPEYSAARAAWAGPTSSMQAMNEGQRALSMNRDAVASMAGRQSPSDQDFFRLGAGRAITDRTSDPARAPGFARRMLEDRQMQARLEAIQPDQARREALQAALRGEVQTATVDRAISPRAGSQTARLQAGGDDMAIDPPGGFLMGLLQAGRQGGVGGAAARGMETLYRRGQGINASTADALASRLFNMDPAQNAATAQRLTQRELADMAQAQARQDMMARLLRGIGTAQAIEN